MADPKEEKLGDPLRMKWDAPPAYLSTARDALLNMHDNEESRATRKAQQFARVAAGNVPYHPLVLAGRYHTFRIASKFPVPGGAIQDDKRRAGAFDTSTETLVADAAKMRAEMERQAEAAGIAAELAALRNSRVLPVRDEDVLPGVKREQEAEEDADWTLLHRAKVPHWPRNDMFPAGENELHIFRMIKDGNVEGIRSVVGRRDLEMDVADPQTFRTPLMTAALYGRLEMVEASHGCRWVAVVADSEL